MTKNERMCTNIVMDIIKKVHLKVTPGRYCVQNDQKVKLFSSQRKVLVPVNIEPPLQLAVNKNNLASADLSEPLHKIVKVPISEHLFEYIGTQFPPSSAIL